MPRGWRRGCVALPADPSARRAFPHSPTGRGRLACQSANKPSNTVTEQSTVRHDSPDTLGILLVNLGTPDSPSTADVRRYLKEFLWDPRVVELPRPVWWLVLNGVILNTRPRRSAAASA